MTAIQPEPSRADIEAVCREMGLKSYALYKLVAELKRDRGWYSPDALDRDTWLQRADPNRVAARGRGVGVDDLVSILRWRRKIVDRYMDAVSRAGFDVRRWSINDLHFWYIAPGDTP